MALIKHIMLAVRQQHLIKSKKGSNIYFAIFDCKLSTMWIVF